MPTADLRDAFLRSGKVRDLYVIDDERLALVATDRISAFDVVLPTSIPGKGKVLTGISRFWFETTRGAGIVPNHLLGSDPATLPDPFAAAAGELRGRLMICRRTEVLPIEVIVRGYISGTGWKDYQRSGTVCGIRLPAGLRESDRLPEPLFTPSTKATQGHDQNIDYTQAAELIGEALAGRVRNAALALYRFGAERAESAGIILADTKFEFGVASDGTLLLVDEVMTPDSSRFWDVATYEPGRAQASFDKQFVRDWLERQPWDKTPPGPELPDEVVAGTRERYTQAFERITGASFARYLVGDTFEPLPSRSDAGREGGDSGGREDAGQARGTPGRAGAR